jgi:tRNA(Ile)-lysidine synthase
VAWFATDGAAPHAAREPLPALVRAAIEAWPAPPTPARFAVAFSGGADSTVLLAALVRVAGRELVRALHVDHGLSAASSDWARHCVEAAAELGVRCDVARVAVERRTGFGLEAAARAARYRQLGDSLEPAEVLLTAHHADDQLETLLLRIARGAGVRGMRGIVEFAPFARGFLGRPLLHATRATLRAAAVDWGLRWLEDPSNEDSRHDRNWLRHRVLPSLLERWPAAAGGAVRLAAQMADAEAILESVAAADAAKLEDPLRVPRAALEALDAPRQRNLLRHLVRRAGFGVPSAAKLEEIRAALLHSPPESRARLRWPGGEVRIHRGVAYLLAPLEESSPAELRAALGRGARWSGPEGDVLLVRAAADEPGLPDSWLDAGLTLKFRAGGERFRRSDRPHARSLKHWLQDAGVVPWMRSRIPLLYRGDELVAVGDLWLAAGAAEGDGGEPRWRVVWERHPPLR